MTCLSPSLSFPKYILVCSETVAQWVGSRLFPSFWPVSFFGYNLKKKHWRARENQSAYTSSCCFVYSEEDKAETTMSEKKNEDYLAVAPPKRSGWESFKLFIWNGETSEFLGRSASSWGKLSSVLISHFFFCLLRMVRSCTLRSDSGKIGDERGQTQWLTTFDPVQTYTRNQTKGAGLTRTRSKINTLVVRGTYMKEEKKTWGSFLLGQKDF